MRERSVRHHLCIGAVLVADFGFYTVKGGDFYGRSTGHACFPCVGARHLQYDV
jgi:hypothetical protein